MLSILLAAFISQAPQIIYLKGSTYNVNQVNAVIITDADGKTLAIIIPNSNPPLPNPNPNPNPNPLPVPPKPMPSGYGVRELIVSTISGYNLPPATIKNMADMYKQAHDHIYAWNQKVGVMSKSTAQNLVVTKTKSILGQTLPQWKPFLDEIVTHMDSIANRLTTSKELADYYNEIGQALETVSSIPAIN